MEVAQYLFQSPSTSQVQIGKLDPSSKETNTQENSNTNQAPTQSSAPAKTAAEIMTGKSAEVAQVTPTVQSDQILDVYA